MIWVITRRLGFVGVDVTHRPSGLHFWADSKAEAAQLIANGRYEQEIADRFAVKAAPRPLDETEQIIADPDRVLRQAFNIPEGNAMQINEAEREYRAGQQPITASRPERDLCTVVLAEQWSPSAPQCPNEATRYVSYDDYRAGARYGDSFYPGETMTRLCVEHEQEFRGMPGFRWAAQYANPTRTDEMEA